MKGKIILAAMLLASIVGSSREAMAAGSNLKITNQLSSDFNYSVYNQVFNAPITNGNITGIVKAGGTATIAIPSSLRSSNGHVMIQFWKTNGRRSSTDPSSLPITSKKDLSGNYGITFTSLTNVNVLTNLFNPATQTVPYSTKVISYPAVAIDSNSPGSYTPPAVINPYKTLLIPLYLN
jgi:hypothetical protein